MSQKKKITKTILLFLLSISILTSINSTSKIIRNNSFWVSSTDSLNSNNSATFNLCFSGIPKQTNYLILEEPAYPLKGYIDITSVSFYIMNSSKTITTGASLSETNPNLIYINLLNYTANIYFNYCVSFTTTVKINSFKNLKIKASSSFEDYAIDHAIIYNFSYFDYYNISTKSLSIQSTDSSVTTATIDKSFDTVLELLVSIPDNKILLTKENVILILRFSSYLSLPTASDISFEAVNEDDYYSQTIDSVDHELDSSINAYVFKNFSENLVNTRNFKILVKNISFNSSSINNCVSSQDKYTVSVELMWKNTNSIISSDTSNLGISCSKYTISNDLITHINGFPKIYTGSSWPLKLSFSVNATLNNQLLEITSGTSSTSIVGFIPSTCSWKKTLTASTCYNTTTEKNKLYVTNASFSQNVTYNIYFWISIDSMAVGKKLDSSMFNFTVEIKNYTNVKSITNIPEIFTNTSCFLYSLPSAAVNGVDGECLSTSSNCVTEVMTVENTTNFVVKRDGETKALDDFAEATTAEFILEFSTSNSSNDIEDLNNDWALEIGDNSFDYKNIIKGQHRFYIPLDYLKISLSNLSSSAAANVMWKSNFQTTATIDGRTILDYSNYPTTSKTNAYYNNQANGLEVMNNDNQEANVIFFNNNDLSSSQNMTTGLFHYLNFVFSNSNSDTTQYSASAPTGTTVDSDTANNTIHQLKFNFVNISYSAPYSIYNPFDLIHGFFRQTSSGYELVRINRFVSLLPQLDSIFQIPTSNTNQLDNYLITNIDILAETTSDGICLLSVLLSRLNENDIGANSILVVFLNNISLLDFENMNKYPSSLNTTAKGVNNYVNANMFNSDSDMVNFFSSKLEIPISDNNNTQVYIPYNCRLNSYSSSVKTSYRTIRFNFSNSQYSEPKYYFYNDSVTLKEIIPPTSNGLAEWNYSTTEYRMSMRASNNDYSTSAAAGNSNYIVLMSNYSLLNSSLKFTDSDYNDATTLYSKGLEGFLAIEALLNKISFNSITYSNFVLVSKADFSGTSVFDEFITINEKNFPIVFIKGLVYPADLGNNATINDFNLVLNYKFDATNNALAVLNSSSSIQFKDSIAGEEDTVSSVVNSISIVTENIKSSEFSLGTQYICGYVSVSTKSNTNVIEISSSNITSNTCFQANYTGSISLVSGLIKLSNYSTSESKLSFYICNISFDENNPFTITSVNYLSGDKLLYKYSDSTGISATKNISTDNYSAAVVSSYSYSNIRKTYSKLLLRVTLDHEVFRNMKVEISSDYLSTLIIDNHISTKCEVVFNTSTYTSENRVFNTCEADLESNRIIITTLNEVIAANLSKVFYVYIYPVKVVSLSTIDFIVAVNFVNGISTMFSSSSYKPATTTVIDIADLYTLSSITATSISPTVIGFKGKIIIEFDETSNTDLLSFLSNNNNPSINEVAIYFPSDYYSPLDDNELFCYFNSEIVTNCIRKDNEWIYLVNDISFTTAFTIEIYGLEILSSDYISFLDSKFLMLFNALSTDSRTTWMQGIGQLKEDFVSDLTKFEFYNTDISYNFAVVDTVYSSTDLDSSIDIELHLVIDSLGGFNSGGFSLENTHNMEIYLELPNNLSFTENSDISLYHLENTDTTGTTSDTEYKYTLESKSVYGRIITASISDETSLSNSLRKFILTITNINSPSSGMLFNNEYLFNQRGGIINVVFSLTDKVYIRTFPTLSTITTENDNSNDLLSVSIGNMIKYQRGQYFDYSNNKYYFIIDDSFTITPGTYSLMSISLAKKGTISDNSASTIISISDKTIFFSPQNDVYSVNGRFNSSIDLKIGVNCGIIPGKYLLSLEHTDTSNTYFSNLPVIELLIKESYDKQKLIIYTGSKVQYSSSSQILLGIGGFTNFYVQTSSLSISDITVSFSKLNESVVNKPPSNLVLPANSIKQVINTYSSQDTSVITIQQYSINISGNSCFTNSPSSITFYPSLVLSQINEDLNLSSIISFVDSTSTSSTDTLTRIELKFTFDGNQIDIPNGARLFCSLYCSNLSSPSTSVMTTLPLPDDTQYINYYFTEFKDDNVYQYVFENLIRDFDYKLKCLLSSGFSNSTLNNYITTELSMVDSKKIETYPTQSLICIDIYVYELSESFDTQARTILQNVFFDNFEENGCVVVVNNMGEVLSGYENMINLSCTSNSESSNDSSKSSDDSESASDSSITDSDTISESEITNSTESSIKSRILYKNSNKSRVLDDTNTNTTSIYYRYCLMQSQKCPYDVDESQVNKKIDSLFTSSNSRRLNSDKENNSDRRRLTTSSFVESLSSDLQSNFYSYKKITPDEGFQASALDFDAESESDFEIKDSKVELIFYIKYSGDISIQCYWALNDIPSSSQDPPTSEQIKTCDTNVNSICSDSNGVVIEIGENYVKKTIDSSALVNGKTYTYWMTCRENLYISRIYSNPFALISMNVVLTDSECSGDDCQNECNINNSSFPGCCTFYDESNPTTCATSNSSYYNKVGYLILTTLIFFLI